jgi:hypothetical protein
MSSIYSYFTSYFYNNDVKIEKEQKDEIVNKPKFLITSDDLKKLNLKSTENIIPAPSRNMPLLDTFELCVHNKAQLDEILEIRLNLKPTIVNTKPAYYPPKNPVINEMNKKFGLDKIIG